MKRVILGIAAAAMTLALAPTAQAQQQICEKRADIMRHLADKYDERPVAMGVQPNGTILEIVASKMGTWTIIVTAPTGVSCAMTAGEAWQAHPQVAQDPGA